MKGKPVELGDSYRACTDRGLRHSCDGRSPGAGSSSFMPSPIPERGLWAQERLASAPEGRPASQPRLLGTVGRRSIAGYMAEP